jgi:hypothetical protein
MRAIQSETVLVSNATDDPANAASGESDNIDDLSTEYLKDFGNLPPASAAPVAIISGLVSWQQLLESPEQSVSYLVDGLFSVGGSSLWVAKPKVGKSTLAQNLAFCVATGDEFLNRRTTSGSVLYLALEEAASEVRKHFSALGLKPDAPLHFRFERLPEDTLKWLETMVQDVKPALIIVDTIQKFTRVADISNYAAVTNSMDQITNLARRCNAHVAFTHHGTKAQAADPGDAALGSTALFGGVDTLVHIAKADGVRTISTIQRYGTDMPETVIELDQTTYRLSLAGLRTDAKARSVIESVVDFLETCSEAVDESQVTHHLDVRRADALVALTTAANEGRIVRRGSGVKGKPYLYERLAAPVAHFGSPVPNPGKNIGNGISGGQAAASNDHVTAFSDLNPETTLPATFKSQPSMQSHSQISAPVAEPRNEIGEAAKLPAQVLREDNVRYFRWPDGTLQDCGASGDGGL